MKVAMPFSSISLLALLVLVPCTTPRPVSLVHKDPAEQAPLLGKVSSESPSAFAAAASAAKAAAAAAECITPAETPPVVISDASKSVPAVNVALVGGASPECGPLLPPPSPKARALAVVGEQARLMVAGTVDGQVHGLDPTTGDHQWSFSTGEPLIKSFQQSPGALDEKHWLIPALDGSMLVHTAQGLRRPSFNTRALVEQTPFLAPGGTFYTGSKSSRIFGLDAHTGALRQVLSGDTADNFESVLQQLSGSDDDVIWIGRIDHTARAFDVATGQEEWNLTIGEFVSLDGLFLSSSTGGGGGGGSGGGGGGGTRVASRSDPTPGLVATPDGSLRLMGNAVGSNGGTRPIAGSCSSVSSVWNAALPTHVASVFQVTLEEGSAHTYLPLQRLRLTQSASDDASGSGGGGSSGGGGGGGVTAAVGVLEHRQLYAVALDEVRHEGEDSGDSGCGAGGAGGGRNAGGGGGGVVRGTKNRAGDGNKVTHGGRATATQPLLPHSGEWQREGDSVEHGGTDGGGHGVSSSALVQSLSVKGSSHHGAFVSLFEETRLTLVKKLLFPRTFILSTLLASFFTWSVKLR